MAVPVMSKPYDPAVHALAEYFLRDEPSVRNDPELFALCCGDLASEIQDVIDDWLFVRMPSEPLDS